jgi:hypothetical protein
LRYQAQVTRRVTEYFQQIDDQIKRELSAIDGVTRSDEVDAALVGIRLLIRETWAQVSNELAGELAALAEYEARVSGRHPQGTHTR